MEQFYKLPVITSNEDALRFFKKAVEYRKNHRNEYGKIARFVFDSTHQLTIGIELAGDIDELRAEFIALEAPGVPLDNATSFEAYDDYLWRRLESMIDLAIEKRTV